MQLGAIGNQPVGFASRLLDELGEIGRADETAGLIDERVCVLNRFNSVRVGKVKGYLRDDVWYLCVVSVYPHGEFLE